MPIPTAICYKCHAIVPSSSAKQIGPMFWICDWCEKREQVTDKHDEENP